jgi:O-methyltransferase involved in polyketide biosynthesis
LDQIVSDFAVNDCQIVSLGSGSDTRPLRLQQPSIRRYIELDFPLVTGRKIQQIIKGKLLGSSEYQVLKGGTMLRCGSYTVIPCDLREWDAIAQLLSKELDKRSLV